MRATQVELAGMIGSTRESVNKWLGSYERQGFLRRQRGVITILTRTGCPAKWTLPDSAVFSNPGVALKQLCTGATRRAHP